MRHRDALDLLGRETNRARRGLAIERLAQAGFWFVASTAAWATIALAGLQERLPLLLQTLSAIAVLCLLAWLGVRASRSWTPPTDAEARARLAADSRFDAAAFEALQDRPSHYDAFALALWRKEQEQAAARVEHARAAPARIRLDPVDRFKVRYLLAALLLAATLFGGGDAGGRLARAFLPDPGPLFGDREMAVEGWLAPAEYTHAAPISLSDQIGGRIEAPPSSEATVRLTGPAGAPSLVFEGPNGRREARFRRAADGAWEARMHVPGAGRLKIVRFHTRASWRISPLQDAPPAASFAAPITALPQEHAAISWRASDDYGLRRLALRIRPLHPPPGLLRADPVDTELESPAGDPREAESQGEVDLAAHPYAGLEVEARIVAFDALGQEGVSDPMHFTMPEKVFLQPLARAAIEIRRHLLSERRPYRDERRWRRLTLPMGDIVLGSQRIEVRGDSREPSLSRAPEGIRQAVRLTDALTVAPQDGYFRDLAVFLGLRLARSELAAARNIDETEVAADTLWRTALRAEYGGAADARRALEEAQRQLSEALAAGAPPERLRQLFDTLRQAADAYMQALVQQAIREGRQSNSEDTQDQTQISGRDIDDLLRQAQQLSEQGRTAEAQRLLDMLAGILANLDVQLSQGEGQDGDDGQQQQLQQSMDGLSQAIGEQRALNNETRQQSQDGGRRGGPEADALAERQSEIRRGLAEAQRMADDAGVAPGEDLEAAGQAMRQAEQALRGGDLRSAETAQAAALEELRDGADELAAEIHNRERQQRRSGQAGLDSNRDPLGRSMSGGNGDEGIRVPNQSDPARARQILDDILQRAQDPNRPEAERDYLRRLLDRFGGGS